MNFETTLSGLNKRQEDILCAGSSKKGFIRMTVVNFLFSENRFYKVEGIIHGEVEEDFDASFCVDDLGNATALVKALDYYNRWAKLL